MPNSFLTNSIVTKMALPILENKLSVTININHEYNDEFEFGGAKLGQTLNIRKPAQYIGNLGQAASVESIQETFVPLSLSFQRNITTEISSQDLELSIDEYDKRILSPQLERLANLADVDVCTSLAKGSNNAVGVPGTAMTSMDSYWGCKTRLDNLAAPTGDRYAFLNPLAQQKIGNAVFTNFNPQKDISAIYTKGSMGYALGADFMMSQNIYVHIVGTLGGTPLTNGANQSGSSIVTDGWTSTTLHAGDVISFSGINAVNPMNLQDTGELAQFVVTQDIADSSGSITIPISPAVVGPGSPYQNVVALPGDNVGILVFGTASGSFSGISGKKTPQNLFMQKDGGTVAFVDLPSPQGAGAESHVEHSDEAGLAIRVARQWNVLTDQWFQRTDILYGIAVLRQQLIVRAVA